MSGDIPRALITGASTGIGAVYADRFARRGYDLVLVARDQAKLESVAKHLRTETGRQIDVLVSDLTQEEQIQSVETLLRRDQRITLLINNAGAVQQGNFSTSDPAEADRLNRLNVQAPTRLIMAALPRFLSQGSASIINVGSVVGFAPGIPFGIYSATKAYLLALSESLHAEVGSKGIYVQAVLPGATRTELWERSGRAQKSTEESMDVDELVDAALIGFDRKEIVTIPTLPAEEQWDVFAASRYAMFRSLLKTHAAERYRQQDA